MPKKITEALIAQHLQTLRDTLPRIAHCVQGLDEEQLQTRPKRDEWSVVENLAHLRACAELWSYTIYLAILRDTPVMAYVHPREWMNMQDYHKLTFAENLLAMEVGRKNLLRKLEGLRLEDWARDMRFLDKANTLTIFDQLHRMATHETEHCEQIEAQFTSG